MINVGLYYRVKEGHEKEFERIFSEVVKALKSSNTGFVSGRLYRAVDDSREYLIYTEWQDIESFREFVKSRAFSETQEAGRSILDGAPRHKVFQALDE